MAGETATVAHAFREPGFDRRPGQHGPTPGFGGTTRTFEIDRQEMAPRFRRVIEDILSGAFARRLQDEARAGYPMLGIARAMMHGASPITEAEERLRARAERPAS